MCGPDDAFTARPGNGFGTNGPSFTSTLSGTATFALNGTLVECFGPGTSRDVDNRVGNSTLEVLGQYVHFNAYLHKKTSRTHYTQVVSTPKGILIIIPLRAYAEINCVVTRKLIKNGDFVYC